MYRGGKKIYVYTYAKIFSNNIHFKTYGNICMYIYN